MKVQVLIAALICAAIMPLSGLAQSKQPSTTTSSSNTTTSVQTATTSKSAVSAPSGKTKTSKPVKGIVVSLITLKPVKGADAGAMANKNALGLMVGSRIYYVLKADGSSAGDDLARLADAPVGVIGKTMSRGGMTVFLADIIDTMK